jgi:hypothetical protein
MSNQLIVSSLLGREKSAMQTYLKTEPVKIIPLNNGWMLYMFDETAKVREVYVGPDGRIARCGFAKELRKAPRVTAAHFISVQISGFGQDDLQGMVLDMSLSSLRLRLKQKPEFITGSGVTVDFCFHEGGESHHMQLMAVVHRTSIMNRGFDMVLLFEPPDDEDHPYLKYIRCRECEIVHGKKYCVTIGNKCKSDLPKGLHSC